MNVKNGSNNEITADAGECEAKKKRVGPPAEWVSVLVGTISFERFWNICVIYGIEK